MKKSPPRHLYGVMPSYARHRAVCRALITGAFILSHAARAQVLPGEPSRKSIAPYEATATPGPVLILPSPDSALVGMYAATDGRQILPPRYYNVAGYEPGDTLRDPIIFLMDSARNRYGDAGFTVLPGYEVKCGAFTRGGLLLYEPVWFDSGPDYWADGRQRFVYDNRMGFVNRFGVVTVPARYPYVSPYRAGTAWACLDCRFEVVDSADAEHGSAWVGTRFVLVDKEGGEGPVQTLPRGEYPAGTQAWPPQSVVEERLAAALQAGPVAAQFRKVYHLENREVVARVYDRPSVHSPYYHFGLEADGDGGQLDPDYQFLVSPDGRKTLHLAGPGMRVEEMEAWWARERAAEAEQ